MQKLVSVLLHLFELSLFLIHLQSKQEVNTKTNHKQREITMKKKGNTSLTSPKILWSICLVLIFLMTGNAMGKVNGSHVQMDTALSQTKVLRGDSGNIYLALTLVGAEAEEMVNSTVQPVDLVVVLDRSGSMGGQKINFARNAIIQLINFMGGDDRLALITYSNSVEVLSPLVHLQGGQGERVPQPNKNRRSEQGDHLLPYSLSAELWRCGQ